MKRILITGAGGFVGRHLCRALIPQNEVWGLAFQTPRPTNASGQLHWITHDLTAPWPASLPPAFDAVVHLAQSSDYRSFPERGVQMFAVNCLGVQRLVDFASRVGVKVFVYASTGGIYGSGPQPFKETSAFNPDGPLRHYLTTKLIGELLLADYGSSFTPVILRPFFIYGMSQKPGMLIPRLITRIARGERITLHGEQGIKINPVHVSDMVAATIRALERTSPLTANVGGPEVLHLRDIAQTIGSTLGKPPEFDMIQSESPPHLVGEIGCMTRELVQPKVRFADAIAEICREVARGDYVDL